MADMEEKQSSSGSSCCLNHCSKKQEEEEEEEKQKSLVMLDLEKPKQPGGWKTMPFIIGNETFERLAAFGLLGNFMVYLKREFHLNQVAATNFINIYFGVANFAPLFGALISDTYLGRFWTIAIASLASFLGMVGMTLGAWIPSLRPAPCPLNYQKDQAFDPTGSCQRANGHQIGFLVLSLSLLCIGTGGIRPCSIPFGVDQFDHTTEKGRRGINSYYNWYYTTFTIVVMIAITVIVYIQDSISWVIGFGIPTLLMLGSIFFFFIGRPLYVYVKPQGSVFSSILSVFVASYKKRTLSLPPLDANKEGVLFNLPPSGPRECTLPLTAQYSFLNKAAIIQEGEVNIDGKPNPGSKWSLCSIQELEEVKCLIRVLPIWASGIISFSAAVQQYTFVISQAMTMNRRIGPTFQIPPGSIGVVSMLTLGIWVPIYDRITVPTLRRLTRHEEGITLLQRMGIGLIFSIFSMLVAGLAERKRRNLANDHGRELSIAWLIPQLVLMGFTEAFNFIGQLEFYNKQFPVKLSSLATSLFFCTIGVANYLNTAMVSLVHGVTGGAGKPDWLTNDINEGRLDNFYYLLAIMGCFNLVYFVVCAMKYQYKGVAKVEDKCLDVVELNLVV